MKGPNFLVLHEKFEELYDEVNEWYDEYAERMLMRKSYTSMKQYLLLSWKKQERNPNKNNFHEKEKIIQGL